MMMLENGLLQNLFQYSIVEKVPGNIDNGLLVFFDGDIHTPEAFNWVVTWAQV